MNNAYTLTKFELYLEFAHNGNSIRIGRSWIYRNEVHDWDGNTHILDNVADAFNYFCMINADTIKEN